MINNVTLVGRLVAPPDLRKTPNNVSSLQGTADIIAQYCSKGSLIGIIGRIQVRSYEKNGQRRYVTEVVAESVALLESRNSQHGQGNNFQNGNNSKINKPCILVKLRTRKRQ